MNGNVTSKCTYDWKFTININARNTKTRKFMNTSPK